MTTTTVEQEPITSGINPFCYRRRATRVVMVGDVAVGGHNPIRVQSMTTTRTQDVGATAAQAERLVRAGCEIVRITAPTVRDARAIGEVRAVLRARGIRVPLVADIHFSPEAAMAAADHVEKVRINPGNYADSRKFAVREYSDNEYGAEIERIEERVSPLIIKLKERSLALRIGTNHGSLSDRIMNRYGDTPRGMVESALEFVRICEKHGFHDIILSMKASNPTVMIAAYRLLAAYMARAGMDYPFHLGVTEAGNGEDARIKSAAGIGALLLDGIGDTVRVSLAEEPEEEIPVARALAELLPAALTQGGEEYAVAGSVGAIPSYDPLSVTRRHTRTIHISAALAGGGEHALVITPRPTAASVPGTAMRALPIAGAAPRAPRPDAVTVEVHDEAALAQLAEIGWKGPGAPRTALIAKGDDAGLLIEALAHVEGIYLLLDGDHAGLDVPAATAPAGDGGYASSGAAALAETTRAAGKTLIVESDDIDDLVAAARAAAAAGLRDVALSLRAKEPLDVLQGQRLLAARLDAAGLDVPLHFRYAGTDPLIPASAALGALLCDGIGDSAGVEDDAGNALVPLTFNLLQATRRRITKTDYVACPSCGRTLFDLQSTTERVKERTAHLVGVKIAIMGCVVNGPGEMADADFGYVGGAPGKVNLYVGKECVERNVPEADAADRLVDLIKERGRWVEESAEDADDT